MAQEQIKSNLGPSDPKDPSRGQVELKKGVYSVMLITEAGNAILLNEDIYDFYFIEDIFKYSMVGKLVFNDRYNFMENGPFTGQEKVALIYGKGDADQNMIFDIWKIGKISQSGPGIRETSEQMIEIYFVDPYYAALSLRRYSRSWKNERYSDIIRDIMNNMLFVSDTGFPINIETSSNRSEYFYMPYWTPRTALSWLSKRAKGSRTGTSGYLIFNNTVNGITCNAVSMNYLLGDVDATVDRTPYKLQSDRVSEDNKILEWWISGLDRTGNQTLRGGYWRGHDFLTKSFLQVGHQYSDGTKKNVMLGRKTLYQRIDDLNCANWTPGDDSIETLSDIAFNDWAKRYNMQFILNIVVEGDEKRFAGQHIEIEWPGIKGSEKMNDALKGKYMIKSVTHSFWAGSSYPYRQRLVCIKNAYHNSKSVILHDSTVTNLYTERRQPNIIRRN